MYSSRKDVLLQIWLHETTNTSEGEEVLQWQGILWAEQKK